MNVIDVMNVWKMHIFGVFWNFLPKIAFFGHQMALFEEKLRKFGAFCMTFWKFLKFLTNFYVFKAKNSDFNFQTKKWHLWFPNWPILAIFEWFFEKFEIFERKCNISEGKLNIFKAQNLVNLSFFSPNDRDIYKKGVKYGTLPKNFSNFPRSPENWGVFGPFWPIFSSKWQRQFRNGGEIWNFVKKRLQLSQESRKLGSNLDHFGRNLVRFLAARGRH
jgi:hypothetical protein